ncbi:MAG: hypothetical protein CHACPFDD_00175 [Phycisphaerae bacterium]|nr:hypothetical protein [Phycisphaerae bacterium]
MSLALLAPLARASEYTFTLVDAFATDYGLRECYIYDINDAGMACGTATIRIPWNGGWMTTYTGFVWTAVDGKTPAASSWPHGLNMNGVLAGVGALFDIHSGQATNMPLLPSTYQPLILHDVNDAGIAVGSVQICNCSNSQGLLQIPYVWDAAHGPRSLSVAGANGLWRITNSGLVIGWIGGNNASNGFLYDLETGQYTLLSSVFSGANIQTTAADVTEDGVVVGSRRESDGHTYGYTWSQAEGVTLLPLPPAGFQPYVRPTSLNSSGIVVGSIYDTLGSSRAFVYDAAHGIRDLHAVSDAPAEFTMMTATRVNEAGCIVGYGYGGGGMYKSFVLRPRTFGDMNCDGSVNGFDVDGFVLALSDPSGYASQYPNCNIANGDVNADGSVSGFDVDGFVVLLGG